MMPYTVTFSEIKHPVFTKLYKVQELKKIAWLYGCCRSGKTSLINQIFSPQFIFSYPTVLFQEVAGTIDCFYEEDPHARYQYSSYLRRWSQIPDFIDEYMSWTVEQLGLTPSHQTVRNLLASRNHKEFAGNLIKYHQAGEQVRLGSITWLVQVNILVEEDRQFVEYLSFIHSQIARMVNDDAPNLVFESWFPDGSGLNFQQKRLRPSADPPTRRPPEALPIPQQERENVRHFVRWEVNEPIEESNSNQSIRSTSVNKVYEQALRKYLISKWQFLAQNSSALQKICDTVKDWAGFHFGSIEFVLNALEENHDSILPDVCGNRLEQLLENYIEGHDLRFKTLMEEVSLSLQIGKRANTGNGALAAWNQKEISKQKNNLWSAGINIADTRDGLQLIKLVEFYQKHYPQHQGEDEMITNETTLIVTAAMQLAKWLWPVVQPGITSVGQKLSKEVASVLITKLESLFGKRTTELDLMSPEQLDNAVNEAVTILPTLEYTDQKLLQDIQLALNDLLQNKNNYTLPQVHKLYAKYVNAVTQINELVMRFSLDPQTGIAQEIIQTATVDRRLPELIQEMRHPI